MLGPRGQNRDSVLSCHYSARSMRPLSPAKQQCPSALSMATWAVPQQIAVRSRPRRAIHALSHYAVCSMRMIAPAATISPCSPAACQLPPFPDTCPHIRTEGWVIEWSATSKPES